MLFNWYINLTIQVKFDQFVEQGRVLHNYASILELLLRLRQCCDHPFLVMRFVSYFGMLSFCCSFLFQHVSCPYLVAVRLASSLSAEFNISLFVSLVKINLIQCFHSPIWCTV